jgi:hypothetical protein
LSRTNQLLFLVIGSLVLACAVFGLIVNGQDWQRQAGGCGVLFLGVLLLGLAMCPWGSEP